jgi:hypothetical protein
VIFVRSLALWLGRSIANPTMTVCRSKSHAGRGFGEQRGGKALTAPNFCERTLTRRNSLATVEGDILSDAGQCVHALAFSRFDDTLSVVTEHPRLPPIR